MLSSCCFTCCILLLPFFFLSHAFLSGLSSSFFPFISFPYTLNTSVSFSVFPFPWSLLSLSCSSFPFPTCFFIRLIFFPPVSRFLLCLFYSCSLCPSVLRHPNFLPASLSSSNPFLHIPAVPRFIRFLATFSSLLSISASSFPQLILSFPILLISYLLLSFCSPSPSLPPPFRLLSSLPFFSSWTFSLLYSLSLPQPYPADSLPPFVSVPFFLFPTHSFFFLFFIFTYGL